MNVAAQVDTQRDEYGPFSREEWVPKVGERVRFVRDSTAGGARFGWTGQTGVAVSEVRHSPRYGASIDVKLDSTDLGFNPAAYLSDIEPLPVAAEAQPSGQSIGALKIEAGKFYRTRDGRKVGPMEDQGWQDGEPWTTNDTMRYWSNDGTRADGSHYESDDLIAEWVDEPAVQAATVANDNAAPAKFRVGDRFNYAYANDSWQNLVVERRELVRGEWNYWATDPVIGVGCFCERMMKPVAVADSNDNEPVATKGLIKTRHGYGFEIARFGDYVWVDTGKKAPETFRASSLAA